MAIRNRSLNWLVGLGLVSVILLATVWNGHQDRKQQATTLDNAKTLIMACNQMTDWSQSFYNHVVEDNHRGYLIIANAYDDILNFNDWGRTAIQAAERLQGTEYGYIADEIANGVSSAVSQMLNHIVKNANPEFWVDVDSEYSTPSIVHDCGELKSRLDS